ncbi:MULTISPECIES: DUF2752 domain-containing protein [unclassified Acinetobacter]|uniref:DUF2752 domain-containing protein n=1 Tax=unclassified Acinetobacter TaxID=196816 RepID=UPI00190B43DF|nr:MULTISPECIES: DUF2752 domain-containing protein [unclassified Acinetobacter]MBK0063936.1 DUF2752 domain-containing protein [Acinetobacter sp. S55]MBK0067221.1 DUF2752 domain-containing protein [Acinetobacter sp. S54]
MKTNCPTCGSTTSLDALLAFSEASKAFAAAVKLHGKLGTPLINYLGLFRSQNRALKFERALNLLNEITPQIQSKQIQFNRQTFPAPESAWVWAINIMLERRDRGELDTPLQNHNYLYKVITSYKPDQHVAPVAKTWTKEQPPLVTEKSLYEREQELKAHERLKTEPAAVSMADLVAKANADKPKTNRTLNNIPQSQVFAHVTKNRRENETHNQCFERLLAEQEQSN